METYTFWSKTDKEGIKEHKITAESCKKAYKMLKESGYLPEEITLAGWKGV